MLTKTFQKLFFLLNIAFFLLIFVNSASAENIKPVLQVPIPNINFSDVSSCGDNQICNNWIAQYIGGIYNYAIGIVGMLAAIAMMVGGVMWLTAGGDVSRVGEGKAWIIASVTGLVIALTSYAILYQINPNLLNLNPIAITKIKVYIPDTIMNSTVQTAGAGVIDPVQTAKYNFTQPSNEELVKLAQYWGERLGLDPKLILAMMKAESDYKVNATSPKGAMGLMQLMPKTYSGIRANNPSLQLSENAYDPSSNIAAGAAFMKELANKYNNDVASIAAAYNWGPGNYNNYLKNGGAMPTETKNHIAKVTGYYNSQ